MKLDEITKTVEEGEKGTYAAIRFSPETVKALQKYTKDNKIPNGLKPDEYHTTLLYSRKHIPNYEPLGEYDVPMRGIALKCEVWPSTKGKNVLVLTYSCPPLYQRHHKLLNMHGATYDFDEYKPHVTLSYDSGKVDPDKLPEFEDSLEITSEYYEELDAD